MAALEFNIMNFESKSVSTIPAGRLQNGNSSGKDAPYYGPIFGDPENGSTLKTNENASAQRQFPACLAVVDSRNLFRECIVSFFTNCRDLRATGFSSVDDLLSHAHSDAFSLVILFSNTESRQTTLQDMERLNAAQPNCMIVILIDTSDYQFVKKLLEYGARGIIPTVFHSNVVFEAVNLVLAGGTFVPAESLMAAQQPGDQTDAAHPTGLTAREGQVVLLLRSGKSNKLIAYELGLSIGTVKVHLHNIMKKLGAHNRVQLLANNGLL
jgi:DNA-binding NarL/FixJ family response regulator